MKLKPHNEVIYLGKNKYDWYEILLIDNENNRKIKLQFPSFIEASAVMNKLVECMSFCIEVVK